MNQAPNQLKPTIHPQLGKIGLVLTGGSVRGAFQVGALEALYEHQIIPSYIVGASVGAINGATFAAGQIETLMHTFQDIAKSPRKFLYSWNPILLLRAFFWSKSILVNTPLLNVIKTRLSAKDFFASEIKVDILATDFQTGEQALFCNQHPEHQDPELLANVLLASCAIPVIFPPFVYKGHQLFDGGVLEAAPLSFAIKEKCDSIFVIVTDPLEHQATRRLFRTIFSVAARFGSLASSRSILKSLNRCKRVNRDIQAFEKLKSDLINLVRSKVKDPAMQEELKSAILEKMNQKFLSLQEKSYFRVYVVEPEQYLDQGSSTFFSHQMIPHYLDEGYNKTMKLLRRVGVATGEDRHYV